MRKKRMKAIQRIKDELEILAYRSPDQKLTDNDINYLCGIADCLDIINKIERETLKVGTNYYVLSWNDANLSIVIEKRKLERITEIPNRVSYTFSPTKRDPNALILYGKGLYDRVFRTFEEARDSVPDAYIDKTQRHEFK